MAKKKPSKPAKRPSAKLPKAPAGRTVRKRPAPAAAKPGGTIVVDLGTRGQLGGEPAAVARELCRMADDEESKRTAEKLLKQAETLDPRCVLVPLQRGDRAGSTTRALPFYEKALKLVEQNLDRQKKEGKTLRRNSQEARDYQAVHRAIATALEAERRLVDAIPHYQAVLRVEPDDVSTVESLALAFLEAQRVSDAADLLSRFEDVSYFTKALVEFRRNGPTPVAGQFLRRGHSENPHVAALLLGEIAFDEEIPDDLSPGSFGAAEFYLLRAMPAWRDAAGAISWLRSVLGKEVDSRRPRLRDRRAQVRTLLDRLKAVTDEDLDPWRLSVRPLHPGTPSERGQLCVVTNEVGDTLYQSTVFDDVPNTEMMIELLLETAQERKQRPSAMLFDDPRLIRRIETALQSIGTGTRLVEHSPRLDRAIEDLRGQIAQSLDHSDTSGAEDFERIPPSGEIWLVDAQRLPRWVQNDQNRYVRLQSIMVVSISQGVIVSQRVETAEEKMPELVWQTVARAITHPFAGPAQRPAEVRVRTHDLRVALEPRLKPLGVRCIVTNEFAMFDEAHNMLLKSLAEDEEEKEELSLVKAGHSLERIESLYREACRLHRAAPWKVVPPERAVEIKGGRWRRPRYGLVIGQSGLLQGLCIYDSREDLERATGVDSELDDINVLNLFYDEPQALPTEDHDAFLDHNWPVASPEGYPIVMRIRRRKAPQVPSEDELQMLTAFAGGLPDLLGAEGTEVVVDSPAGKVTLSWFETRPDKSRKTGKSKK